MLWSCNKCHDYGLCTACYMAGKHCLEHKFNVQLLNTDPRRCVLHIPWLYFVTYSCIPRSRISVPARVGAQRIEARGIFPGAEVARGCDWVQDGNETICSMTVYFLCLSATLVL